MTVVESTIKSSKRKHAKYQTIAKYTIRHDQCKLVLFAWRENKPHIRISAPTRLRDVFINVVFLPRRNCTILNIE